MSMGGDFYAITDGQLARLLDGELPFSRFFHGAGDEQPRECFSQAEHLWHELSQVLIAENACGANVTEEIPEMCGYSSSEDVARTAAMLEQLDAASIEQRCARADLEEMIPEILPAVQGLTAFYRRAADNGDAVLFHVT